MNEINELWKYLTDSEEIIRAGLIVITLIVFAENGLFFAFFLPGDYLLFLTGVFGGTGVLKEPLGVILLTIFTAAFLGSLTGYLTGRFFGNSLQNRKESWFFKKKNLENTNQFFEKNGSLTLIISRFLPVVRTFAPILAGISQMSFPKFLFYNAAGGAIWVCVLVAGGYYLGEQFPWIVNYVHYVIIFFLAITTFTVVKGYLNISKK
ncbi:membrane-associated protein [Pseudarcicella hirudinis]|uniref:Membrane-associated protein n=1 Tax=Pseudarcicella hirudinis TaxID=1079859 RepID=A0A1I5WMU0_9BACT|nr:DedA family protein [Pseudarcicella hirudinis]SFQ21104.1 membrane-associated protein [Pseudarcicella hirudinis]